MLMSRDKEIRVFYGKSLTNMQITQKQCMM